MILVPRGSSDQQILEIIRSWTELLAHENYQAAFAEIGTWSLRGEWTPEFLRDDITGYRSPEYYPGVENFRVTDWRTAQGGNPEPKQTVRRYKPNSPGIVADVVFDLPLNGRWSSLAADFVLFENTNPAEGYILGLEEISSWEQRTEEETT